MKLVINIPCYNEEKTLPLVLKELPRKIPGVDEIEVQVIDDGSTDGTVAVAKKLGVTRVVSHKHNQGLGHAFKTAIESALEAGADIMVNTDADNAFPGKYIPDLVAPIVTHKADMVVGNRKPWEVKHYSSLKRFFQRIGNGFARHVAGVDVPDMVCGFRAYSRESLLRLNVTTRFSYVLDTIVQAGKKDLRIVSLPIVMNKPTRKSRLFKNMFQHMVRSGFNILRLYVIYEPLKTFLYTSLVFFIPAVIVITRFIILRFFLNYPGTLFLSALFAMTCLILGFIMVTLGMLAELIGMNRRLTEEQLYYARRQRYK